MISSLDYKAHFGGPFFGWKSENVAGWPNTDLKVLEGNQAECPIIRFTPDGGCSHPVLPASNAQKKRKKPKQRKGPPKGDPNLHKGENMKRTANAHSALRVE